LTCDSLRSPLRGVGRVCDGVLRELIELGQDVVPLGWIDNGEARAIAGRCVVLPARPGPGRTARWHAGLLRRLRRIDLAHDVLVNVAPFPHVLGEHPRLVLYVHDLHMLEGGFYQPGKRAWFRAFLGRSLRKAAHVVCVSNDTRNALLHRYSELDPARVSAVHLWADACLAPDGDEPGPARPYFLVVGQIERRKNTLRLLDAFAAARRRGVTTELRLAGRAGHGGAAALARLALPDLADAVHVHEAPTDRELRGLYRSARGLLFPSLHEGFGLPLLEAMQAGIPILTSDRSALPEVAGDAALLVDPEDTTAIAQGIERLDRDSALRNDLVARGQRRLTAFARSDRVRELLGILERVRSTA
jgi:glycosyltransferase involved in cell wall biosynthesis